MEDVPETDEFIESVEMEEQAQVPYLAHVKVAWDPNLDWPKIADGLFDLQVPLKVPIHTHVSFHQLLIYEIGRIA